jgi:hypothetical protein
MSITTDILTPAADHMRKAIVMSDKLRATATTLAANETDALTQVATKATDDKKGGSGATRPDDCSEPATGNTDRVGDAAISHRLTQIHNQRDNIIKALNSLNKAIDHVIRTAHTADNHNRPKLDQVDNRYLCSDGCNRLREPGRNLCIGCGAALARIERQQAHPECGKLGCTKPVERYETKAGTAYVGMHYDGDTWQPNGTNTPTCSTCRLKAAA